MKLIVDLKDRQYPIWIERKALYHIDEIINTHRKIAIIHDDAIPSKWIEIVKKQCENCVIFSFPEGENSKCFEQYQYLLQQCIDHHISRKDAIIAIGGGVTGDLAGFVASTYMRGIDFYNIPTTILSQVDSSVGGKVAIDMGSYKNIVGSFYQPKGVLIDPDVLSTLSIRQQHNGLVEALKMGLILDENLVCEFEKEQLDIEAIITRSIDLKRQVVQEDEKENSLRKILNFGHTIGHAIEGAYGLDTYYHGECVAMGMLFFIEDKELKNRVLKIYDKLSLPAVPDYDVDTLMEFISHDKKGTQNVISVISVAKAGSYSIEEMNYEQISLKLLRGAYEESNRK